ncbi:MULTISPECIES: LysE family translocator [unclassified Thalassotalea]|uniref:LysE family translocator n=1 Tax=unclassified Thalassotalea TaxID=2614972 RepID=UPI0010822E06|nr:MULTISPECIES: LysE family translocator [unclassified Thalassotalea]NMP15196.1 LysE family translocator [Thalassotalea sp. Y01]QBY03755.1 LysE family translocator [Thalassotalea sp. HSM 43]
MALELWLSLVLVCMLGALSPGPSLALVVRNTMLGGQRAGLATAIAHGIGVGLYAAIAVTGIGLVIVNSPTLFSVIQYLGAGFLLYMAYQALTSKGAQVNLDTPEQQASVHGWRDGFLIAFLNPKLAIFFIAIFSPFVDVNATTTQLTIMVLTVGIIDTVWYCIVAWGLSRGPVLNKLRAKSQLLDRITGVVLIALALRVAI